MSVMINLTLYKKKKYKCKNINNSLICVVLETTTNNKKSFRAGKKGSSVYLLQAYCNSYPSSTHVFAA